MTATRSVIVPTYRRTQFLFDAVSSILMQAAGETSFEILVVDNEPRENVEAKSFCLKHSLIYLHEPRPGLHFARHAGAYYASGEILVYIDDDIHATEGWLENICLPFDDPRVGVVGGMVLPEWEIPAPEWMALIHPGFLSLLDLGAAPRDLSWLEQVYGCNFAIRKSVLFDVGGFNPDSYADRNLGWSRGDGETGLLKKVYSAGYTVRYEPSACVYHCIPEARLTKSYLLKRAFNQAISDAFSSRRARRFPAENMPGAQTTASRSKNRRAKLLPYLGGILRADAAAWFYLRVKLRYFRARLEYSIRYLMDGKLRWHVSRPNFMDRNFAVR